MALARFYLIYNDPLMSDLPDMTILPSWASWIAQDADGAWWAYEAEPNQHDRGWYENEVGRIQALGYGKPNPDWQSTLIPIAPDRGSPP